VGSLVRVSFTGDLKSLSLSTVLQILSSEDKTGVLEVVRGSRRTSISMRSGRIIAASSGHRELQLGYLLDSKRLVPRNKIEQALKQANRTGKRLGEMLLAQGLIDEDTLKRVVYHQVRETVLDVFLFEEGKFEFHDQAVVMDEGAFEEISAMEIILEAARRMDEWSVMTGVIPNDTVVFSVCDSAERESGEVDLEKNESRIISMLDGNKSVREIIKLSGIQEFQVYKSLYAMAISNLIAPVEKPAAPKKELGVVDLAAFLGIYHEVLLTVCRHLESQVGKAVSVGVFAQCLASVPKKDKRLVAHYQLKQSADENSSRILSVVAEYYQGAEALSKVITTFNRLVKCLLVQEKKVLGDAPTLHTVGQIRELLEVLKKSREEKGRSLVIRSIETVLSGICGELSSRA
jgi:hypothetical protein